MRNTKAKSNLHMCTWSSSFEFLF